MPTPFNARVTHLDGVIAHRELVMRDYIAERDWHGVMDAAADLRELEAERDTLLRVCAVWPVETDR